MINNVGTLDRIIRALVALVIIGLYLMHMISGTLAIILWVIAVLLLVTAALGYCPIYHILGISTKGK